MKEPGWKQPYQRKGTQMEHMKLNESRRMAEEWLEEQKQAQIAGEEDENRRRLLTTLYSRQRDSMDYLGLIRLDMGQARKPAEAAKPDRWETILTHPLCEMVLAVATLALIAMDLQIPAVLTAVLTLVRALLMRTRPGKARAIVAEVHEPYITRAELERFLKLQADRIGTDAEAIGNQYAVTDVRTSRGMENDFGNIYCALYEAQVDDPSNPDIAYPLSIARMNLYKLGYEPVEYAPETAAMFDVLPTEGADQLRCPALRSRETGVVLKKGLMLRRS